MSISKRLTLAGFMGAIAAIYPQEAWAVRFSNSDFLKLPEIQQKGYLDGALNTLWQVAAFNSTQAGQCVYDWYHGSDRASKNSLILASMKKYPENTPSSILIALTERECGRYVRKE